MSAAMEHHAIVVVGGIWGGAADMEVTGPEGLLLPEIKGTAVRQDGGQSGLIDLIHMHTP